MAPSSAVQFIDAALSCTSSRYALSYPEPKQKRVIKKHLLSLINAYPTFRPSSDKFNHDDGTTVYLLKAAGNLRVAGHKYTPPVPLTIWLHENYPYMPPIVFVSSRDSMSQIRKNHPFVDPQSGVVSSSYIKTWVFPRCNVTELVHNLVRIFSHDHPFTSLPSCMLSHRSLASKMEALDRLWGSIHYDFIAFKSWNEEELETLSTVRAELIERKGITRNMISDLEQERSSLKEKVMELTDQADVLINWVRVKAGGVNGDVSADAFFEGEDEESRVMIECLAAERGAEDLICALGEALEEQVVSIGEYIRQVRLLAREQFWHRAMLVKLRGPDILL